MNFYLLSLILGSLLAVSEFLASNNLFKENAVYQVVVSLLKQVYLVLKGLVVPKA